jgi:hypothetical protein
VGIVWSENRSLYQRIKEHNNEKWCVGKKWKIEYLEEGIKTRTDAEYMEAHYISLYKTYEYFNIKKANWGISSFIPIRDDWQLYDFKKQEEIITLKQTNIILQKKLEQLTKENNTLKNTFDLNMKLMKELEELKRENTCLKLKENQIKEVIQEPTTQQDYTFTKYKEKGYVPDFILNKTFYKNISKKNKSNNNTKKDYNNPNGYFYKKKSKFNNSVSIPCKLLLYINGKKKEYMIFDSLKKCAEFCGLHSYDVVKSMEYQEYRTFFYWKESENYSYFEPLFPREEKFLENYEVLIRVSGITPLTQSGKEYFENKYYKRCY